MARNERGPHITRFGQRPWGRVRPGGGDSRKGQARRAVARSARSGLCAARLIPNAVPINGAGPISAAKAMLRSYSGKAERVGAAILAQAKLTADEPHLI
jgi:hypothetical protein